MAKKQSGNSAGAQQLIQDIKNKTPGHFYVIYGEEDYLCRHYYNSLKKLLLEDLTADFNYHRLNGENFSVELLSDSMEALPMMADRSLVLVDEVDLFTVGDTETLVSLLNDVPDYCCLVLRYMEFKPDKRKKKLWEAIEKNAILAEFQYQSESELRAWIVRHFRSAGKDIAPDLCNYLLLQCGRSMTRLHTEIEKICAYSGAATIVREDINAVVEPTLDAAVFEITDALASRNFDRALERLHVMFKLRAEGIAMVGAIGSQMRRLYAAKLLQNADELMRVCGLAPYPAGLTMTQARRFSTEFCKKAVLLCRDTDYQLKSSYDSEERLLELLLLQLAEEARHD